MTALPLPSADSVVHRYWNAELGAHIVKVLPGEHYVTRNTDEVISTVLGSCVAACMRDPVAGVGGINHFMLPGEAGDAWGSANRSLRYGHVAMERLINDLLSAGARRERLETKLFGGANMARMRMQIGDANVQFAHAFLSAEGLPVLAEDVGGHAARRILYFPATGRVMMQALRREPDLRIFNSERFYRAALAQRDTDGSVELFE
ncbi:MAG: chemoreceptor glutamine deamidase CheD [Alphaproteobacteria bacterium]|nr:MAG: chemoreceptor glutamine deamidase CheD [Alphaproteobacteria bacterium]